MAQPPTPTPREVTMLLEAAGNGDSKASGKLLPLVYDQLRRLAQANVNKEPAGLTLQPTALVHEAYVRLVGDSGKDVRWQNRAHFFAAAALAMRRILVDRARRGKRLRHGGDRQRVELPDAPAVGGDSGVSTDLIALDEALTILEKQDPRRYQVVMLRYFAGLTIEDTAQAMGVAPATVKADWAVARVRLFRSMGGTGGNATEKSP